MRTAHTCLAAVTAILPFAVAAHAAPYIIVQDSFTGSDFTLVGGRAPDVVNLPGAHWTEAGLSVYPPALSQLLSEIQSNSALATFNDRVVVDINSAGVYTKPSNFLTLSGDIKMGVITGNGTTTDARSIGLGFFDSTYLANAGTTNGADAAVGYVGLVVNASGEVKLYQDETRLASTAAFVGTFDANTFYHLEYTVDLTTGKITSASFAGNDITSAFAAMPATFADANTDIVGFFGSSTTATTAHLGGFVDNFTIASDDAPPVVPEPASLSLLAIAGAGLLARRTRR